MKQNIGFIGLGNMGEALIKAIKDNNLAESIIGFDVNKKRADSLKNSYDLIIKDNIKDLEKESDIIFLAVKPQNFNDILPILKKPKKLIISIAAGITIENIESGLPDARVIRVMPNTPCLVGEMAGAIAVGKKASDDDKITALELLNSAGKVFLLEEKDIDIVTALSGSGPAFIAYIIQEMARTSIELGLNKDVAYELAAKTAQGTGKLLLEKGISPEELIKMVSSPGGTTVAGRMFLETEQTTKTIKDTINAAYKKALN